MINKYLKFNQLSKVEMSTLHFMDFLLLIVRYEALWVLLWCVRCCAHARAARAPAPLRSSGEADRPLPAEIECTRVLYRL